MRPSRAYYVAFHAVSAVLLSGGETYSRHGQVLGAFNRAFAKGVHGIADTTLREPPERGLRCVTRSGRTRVSLSDLFSEAGGQPYSGSPQSMVFALPYLSPGRSLWTLSLS
jgi:hypothetical protein